MSKRMGIALLMAAALLMPQFALAKTKAKSKASTRSGTGEFRRGQEGPLGTFVDAPDHQVFANVLGFLYGTPTIGYEQALSEDNSFTAQFGFRSQGAANFNVTYLGLIGSYRWWVGNHAKMQGVYVGPLANVSMVNVSYDSSTVSGATVTTKKESASSYIFGVGAEGGYQWILPAGFTFSAGLNAGYYFGSLSLGSGAPSIPFGGVGAGLNGTVGYAF